MKELQEKLKNYIEKFNAQDEECFVQTIDNAHCAVIMNLNPNAFRD